MVQSVQDPWKWTKATRSCTWCSKWSHLPSSHCFYQKWPVRVKFSHGKWLDNMIWVCYKISAREYQQTIGMSSFVLTTLNRNWFCTWEISLSVWARSWLVFYHPFLFLETGSDFWKSIPRTILLKSKTYWTFLYGWMLSQYLLDRCRI